jgi:hypothetical protein
LDKDRFWKEELMQVNNEFLFGCGTGLFSNWLSPKYRGPPRDRKGISENHSYSIMDAKEIDGVRLLKLRYVRATGPAKDLCSLNQKPLGKERMEWCLERRLRAMDTSVDGETEPQVWKRRGMYLSILSWRIFLTQAVLLDLLR